MLSVTSQQPTPFTSFAAIKHCLRIEKLRKVFENIHFNAIKVADFIILKLLEIIDEYLNVFAECDSDVKSINVVFHEIDTGDSRSLRQFAYRILYGEQRDTVKSEI